MKRHLQLNSQSPPTLRLFKGKFEKAILYAFLFVFGSVFTIQTASAHGVQIGYCQLPNGYLRVYVEHWHGDLSANQVSNAPISVTTTIGGNSSTATYYGDGVINNTTRSNLPGCGSNINILYGCSNEANTYNDWIYWDFAPGACNQPISITINAGLTVVTTEACSQLFPQTISGITFGDNSPPILTCPDVNVTHCGPTAVNFAVSANDACDPNPTVAYSHQPGSIFNQGTTQVTATATDNASQSSSCTFNVNVNEPPGGCCPASLQLSATTTPVTCPGGNDGAINLHIGAGQPPFSFSWSHGYSGEDPTGLSEQSYSVVVMDANGCTDQASFSISQVDNIPPTALCQPQTVILDPSTGTGSVTPGQIDNGSSDNCGIANLSFFDQAQISQPYGTWNNNSGGHGQSFTAPISGYLTSISFKVQGNSSGRKIHFYNSGTGSGAAWSLGSPIYTENNVSFTHSSGGYYWTNVTLTTPIPVTAGSKYAFVIEGSSHVYYYNNQYSGGEFIWGYDLSSGCCSWGDMVFRASFENSASQLSLDCQDTGTHNVSLLVTDYDGNSASCSTTVTVIDNVNPTIVCPNNIVTGNNEDLCGAYVSYNVPSFTDNCSLLPTNIPGYTFLGSYGGSNYFLSNSYSWGNVARNNAIALGGHLATITSAGENTFLRNNVSGSAWIGKTDFASEDNFIWDTGEEVTYTNYYPGEPNNYNGNEDYIEFNFVSPGYWNDQPYYLNFRSIVEFDGLGVLVPNIGKGSGSFYPVGTTTLQYRATGLSGNTANCSFTITVMDKQLPKVMCPGNIHMAASQGDCGKIVNFSANAMDNCPGVQLSSSPASGSFFDVGSTTVTYTATDASGNSSNCSFSVNITDTQPPTIDTPCPDNIELCGAQNVSWTPPTAVDNCGVVSTSSSHNPGDFFDVGTHTVSYNFEDAAMLSVGCSFEVTIHPLPEVTILSMDLPEWCQGVKVLTAKIDNADVLTPPISFGWSHDLGTDQQVVALENGLYSVVVTDGNGCSTTTTFLLDVDLSELLSAHTILVDDEMDMESNSVLSGGVGIQDADEITIENFTDITTFLRSSQAVIDATSTVADYINSDSPVSWPDYMSNPFNDNNDVNVNGTMTLSGSNYGNIVVTDGSTLNIANSNIYIKNLSAHPNSTINFLQPTNVMIRKKMNVEMGTVINAEGPTVVFYVSDNVSIGQGCSVFANIYAPEGLDVSDAGASETTYMYGLFIADEMDAGDNVIWNWNLTCSALEGSNGNEPFAASDRQPEAQEIEVDRESSVILFPNPTSGSLNLNVSDYLDQKLEITIYNTYGSVIWNKNINIVDTPLIKADLARFENGVYLVSIKTDNELISKQVVLNK